MSPGHVLTSECDSDNTFQHNSQQHTLDYSQSAHPPRITDMQLFARIPTVEIVHEGHFWTSDDGGSGPPEFPDNKFPRDSGARIKAAKKLGLEPQFSPFWDMPFAQISSSAPSSRLPVTPPEHQLKDWEMLQANIETLVIRICRENFAETIFALFQLNLVRGRGLFATQVIQMQRLSSPLTLVLASLVSVVNTLLPWVGRILVIRILKNFRRLLLSEDIIGLLSTSVFIAYLVSFGVLDAMVALHILLQLLAEPTEVRIRAAVRIISITGQRLLKKDPGIIEKIFTMLQNVLHDADIDTKTQMMIQSLFRARTHNFADELKVPSDLNLVQDQDVITHHHIFLIDIDAEPELDKFSYDLLYMQHEEQYAQIRRCIVSPELSQASGSICTTLSNESQVPLSGTFNFSGRMKQILTAVSHSQNTDVPKACPTNILDQIKAASHSHLYDYFAVVFVHLHMNRTSAQEKYFDIAVNLCWGQDRWRRAFELAFVHFYKQTKFCSACEIAVAAVLFGTLISRNAISWSVMRNVAVSAMDRHARTFVREFFWQVIKKINMSGLLIHVHHPLNQPFFENTLPLTNFNDTIYAVCVFEAMQLHPLTITMRAFLRERYGLLNAESAVRTVFRLRADDLSFLSKDPDDPQEYDGVQYLQRNLSSCSSDSPDIHNRTDTGFPYDIEDDISAIINDVSSLDMRSASVISDSESEDFTVATPMESQVFGEWNDGIVIWRDQTSHDPSESGLLPPFEL